ncbi:class I histocompatibility antigen, F10 alpha chain-like, partial [Python bivittatus]|uniref:Class I histocompatibility antigen, F10 alpha chain-like n=1 Tax=Python bivittatus TaxID=176946 RepID=A0A9F5N0C6_PYTBI
STLHSVKYLYTAMSDPSQGLPQFVVVGYVDDQVFIYYDSNSRKVQPRVSWVEELGKKHPQFWDTSTQKVRGTEEVLRADLETMRTCYNQSEGLHTWQWMCGCELREDGSKGGFSRYGYDGRTFITFDKETLTWVAANPQGEITKKKWDAIPGYNQGWKIYLEEECIEWLEKYLSYGKEMLLRTDLEHFPKLLEMLQEIDDSWRRDGEVWLQDSFRGSVAPNADGTYHYWLSIRINAQERDYYRCHVEHDSLREAVDVALK